MYRFKISDLLDYLICQKITDKILVSVGYEYQKITDYFGNKYKNCQLNYLIEDTPLGTGGAIQLALNEIQTERALIVNGDTLFNVNLLEMIDFHRKQRADLTLALKLLKNFDRYSNVIQDHQNKVVKFEEKKSRIKDLLMEEFI
jgi:D-glycero-alpha-D-manno-heptose 1-phosphate guanylyltransferase